MDRTALEFSWWHTFLGRRAMILNGAQLRCAAHATATTRQAKKSFARFGTAGHCGVR